MALGRPVLGVALLLLLGPSHLSGQEGGDCNVPDFLVWNPRTLSNGTRISYFVRPVIVCGGGVEIRADSAVVFEATNFTSLHGNVSFEDENKRLTSGQAHYFSQSRQLRAWVLPVVTDLARGSVIRGDTIVLLRAGENRPRDRLTVTGRRPHATLYPAIGSTEEADSSSVPDSASADTTGAIEPVADTTVADTTGAIEPVADTTVADTTGAVEAVADTTVADTTGAVEAVADTTGAVEAVADTTGAVTLPADTAVVDTAAVDTGAFVEDPPERGVRRERPDVVADPVGMGLEGAGEEATGPTVEVAETPYEVDANRMELEGSGLFRATGDVVIRRDSLTARADSVEYDEALGNMILTQDARMETESYQLEADSIWLEVPEDELKGVRARENAVLIGDDLHLLAPQIFLFLTEGKMERLVAIGDSALDALTEEERELRPAHPLSRLLGAGVRFPIRPFASAQEFLLKADSIEVIAPEEVLEELKAVGGARGESMARDSLNNADTPDLLRRDWIEGDTIVATFAEAADSTEASADTLAVEVRMLAPPSAGGVAAEDDTTGTRYRLEKLLAQGSARSLYRLEPSDSTLLAEEGRLAVSYVVGDQITILMSEGEVDRMLVDGATHGFHLEPVATAQGGAASDSLAADTLGGGSAAADTLRNRGRNIPETNRRGGDG